MSAIAANGKPQLATETTWQQVITTATDIALTERTHYRSNFEQKITNFNGFHVTSLSLTQIHSAIFPVSTNAAGHRRNEWVNQLQMCGSPIFWTLL